MEEGGRVPPGPVPPAWLPFLGATRRPKPGRPPSSRDAAEGRRRKGLSGVEGPEGGGQAVGVAALSVAVSLRSPRKGAEEPPAGSGGPQEIPAQEARPVGRESGTRIILNLKEASSERASLKIPFPFGVAAPARPSRQTDSEDESSPQGPRLPRLGMAPRGVCVCVWGCPHVGGGCQRPLFVPVHWGSFSRFHSSPFPAPANLPARQAAG